jgi:hypothetical protein
MVEVDDMFCNLCDQRYTRLVYSMYMRYRGSGRMRSTYYPGLVFTVGSAYAASAILVSQNSAWSITVYIHFGILTMQSAICYVW